MIRAQKHIGYIGFLCLLAISVGIATAQECRAVIEDALYSIGDNCEGLGRNQACYGYDQVLASFYNTVDANYFSEPRDVAGIQEMRRLTTSPYDINTGNWGVAVMNLQATLPNTLPGQNVTFILMGNTEVENAVSPENQFSAQDGISATVNSIEGVHVRSGADSTYNVVTTLVHDTPVQADALDPTGNWVRIHDGQRLGWVMREYLSADTSFDTLHVLNPDLRSPMQAFYLRTAFGDAACEDVVSDMLVVQSPDGMEMDLTVNNANIRIGSTVAFRTTTEDTRPYLELTVLDGHATILNENFEPTGVQIQGGQRSYACLGETDNRGQDGEANDRDVSCAFSPPETVDASWMYDNYCSLRNIDSALLNYTIDAPCFNNGIVTSDTPTESSAEVTDNICADFSLIAPVQKITPRPTTFRWSTLDEATQYEVLFYNYYGEFAASYWTQDTSLNLNVGEIPTGSELEWEVIAYKNDEALCTTPRSPQLFRLADPNPPPQPVVVSSSGTTPEPTTPEPTTPEPTTPPPPTGSFTVTWVCTTPGTVTISYQNAPAGTTQFSVQFDDYKDTYSDTESIPPLTVPDGSFSVAVFEKHQENLSFIAQPSNTTANFTGTDKLDCKP